MGWAEAIKAALISIPKILDLVRDGFASLNALVTAMQNAREQERRNEQNFAVLQTLKLQVDADRAEMARRLSLLEQRH